MNLNTNPITEKVKSVKESIMNADQSEGNLTEKVETQTSKLPSMTWLALAGGSIAAAAILANSKSKQVSGLSTVVGLMAPCFMLAGIYNKIVKTEAAHQNEHLH